MSDTPYWRSSFGICYECADGLHVACVGVPCECPCEPKDERGEASERLKIESRKQLQGELAGLMIAYSRGTDFGLRHDRLTNADYSLLSATEGQREQAPAVTPDDAACDELIEDLSEFLSGMALPELRSQVRRRMKSWFVRFSRTPDDAGFTEALREVGESFDAADMEVCRCDQPEEFCGRCAAWAQAHEDLKALARFRGGNADTEQMEPTDKHRKEDK